VRIQDLTKPAPRDTSSAESVFATPAADEVPSPRPAATTEDTPTRQILEIALLKARIQHLELVVETARQLMGSNQERLLRRLNESPREIVSLSAQLRRVDPHATW